MSAGVSSDFSYRKEPITPLIEPMYMIPGIPMFRFPDFSVRISPVQPYSSGMPIFTAPGMNPINPSSIYASFCFLRKQT